MPEPDHWANLLWSVGTESIVRSRGLPWLAPQRRADLAGYFSRVKVRERLAPLLETEMRHRDERQRTARLGIYFENLWGFAFAHHPNYELLHRNLPLRADNRTLGELDFVVRHLPDGSTEHWEVAVKFYLRVADAYWVGPGLRDRLDIKLARMREHQLPLVRQPAAREILRQRDIPIDRQWALMPGRLFRPLGEALAPLHGDINPASCGFWWATVDEFQYRFAGRGYRWFRLPKRAWLADRGYRVPHSDRGAALAEKLRGEEMRRPVCVAALAAGSEVSRGFIVPDDWYEAALERLP